MFEDKAVNIMENLLKDFPNITVEDAAAILGNLGHETGGFVHLQELNPVSGSGGYGWAQWTGPRRNAFISWANNKGLQPSSDAANYGFLVYELRTTESPAIPALISASGLYNKVVAFEKKFERAGVKNYGSRLNYANKALAAYNGVKKNLTFNNGSGAKSATPSSPVFAGISPIAIVLLIGAAIGLIYYNTK